MSVKDSMLASAPPIRLPLPEFPTPPKGIWASSATVWSLLEDAGRPKGVVNVITTTSTRELSDALLADPRLRKVSFTGSTPVGVQLLKKAADNVLKSSMELGGNAPFVVFEDADLDQAVDAAMLAKFRNIGQACTAANRFIVHESVSDEFTRRVTERVGALKGRTRH
jgi:succinate-semialdehyde dehydrogenase/glutarate-semialdehyde dehydrogenase